jgi:hypothetical protein
MMLLDYYLPEKWERRGGNSAGLAIRLIPNASRLADEAGETTTC